MPPNRTSAPLGRLVAYLAGLLLGGVLLLAAVAKVYEPGAFVEQVRLEGLDFLLPAVVVALGALALETGLGVALVAGVHHRVVLVASGLLTLFFLFLTGRNYWLVSQGLRDPEASCGCFGSLIERSPAEAFWQDLLLLVPPLLVLFWLRWKDNPALPRKRLALASVAAFAVAVGTWFSPALRFSEAAAAIAAVDTDRAFRPSGTFQVWVDGELDASSQVLESEGEAGVLVLSAALPGPILVMPRSGSVRQLESGAVRHAEGGILLPPLPVEAPGVPFEVVQGSIQFEIAGHTVRLVAQ